MIPRYQVYREKIATEFASIRRAADKARQAFQNSKRGGQDESFYLDSAALNAYGFYTGVERLFEWLTREFDEAVPGGSAWHCELLERMTIAVPDVRPAVIRVTTRDALEEYLRFRHIVRNSCACEFESGRIADLVNSLPQVLQDLEADLEKFREFLNAAKRADESPEQ
ncbi:MAG: hypothetical protein HY782_27100 [Chloroflexi bacterium]|nr:hypothetical protein [Chloroflexota bacterium]